MAIRKRRASSETDLLQHYLEQLPVVAALIWEDGSAETAAAHAAELVEACLKEAEALDKEYGYE